ncbi:hypothetical protein OESDEN_20656, partial [Oesophagostomum dentatum]
MPLTIEDLVAGCENIIALKMDSRGIEECQDIHAVQKRKVKCYNCGGPHYRSTCLLLYSKTGVFKCEPGRCTKTKAMLVLKDNAIPIFKKKRLVPYASVPDLDKEIDRLIAEGVISTVDHSELFDFLNDALQLHQHPLPTAEEVFTKPSGGQLFTQIDFAEAYLQVEVEEELKEMLTINTHWGLFKYNRLPFGVKSSPGIFQQIMDSMICGLEGVAAYLDN